MAEPCCGTVCTAEIASALGFFWRSSLRREAPIARDTNDACRFFVPFREAAIRSLRVLLTR